VLLWLWCRLEATALIRPLAWEPPCATGAAIKRKKAPPPKKAIGYIKRCGISIIFTEMQMETSVRYSHTPAAIKILQLLITSVHKYVEKREPWDSVGGNE